MDEQRERPITIAMLALGGQGGGVLTGWLVETAEANGYLAQSTYVAGVAQRTGATVYCVEMFPRDRLHGREPVFTPYPIPGDVELVIAGEMAETGRAIEKGFVTPNATTLIASRHRVYSMPEKEALGDGIMDLSALEAIAARAAKRFICFDMQAEADKSGSVISSVMLGAIAASGVLPFSRDAFEQTIRDGGKAVEANLRGFRAGFEGPGDHVPADEAAPGEALVEGPNGEELARRIRSDLAEAVRNMALHGALRLLDYQDARYAHDYVDSLLAVHAVDKENRGYALTAEMARQLALQMAYEDTIRVAELKIRASRFARIRDHVGAADGQPVRVVEYFHPRLDEFCDTLPRFLGRKIMESAKLRRLLSPLFRRGRNITTTGIGGFLTLYGISRLKGSRRRSYRFNRQQRFIADWHSRVIELARDDYDLACAVARCMELVRGYGETYERGLARFNAIMAGASSAAAVDRLRKAAQADEQGVVFRRELQALEAST